MKWTRSSASRAAIVAGACALVLAVDASAAPSARSMYEAALERERAVREELADAQDRAILADVRTLAAAYEAIVRRYPTSGFSDDALWQAGRLELDAFARFGKVADRAAGVRILHSLAAQYPSSALAKQVASVVGAAVRAELARPTMTKSPGIATSK